MSDLVHNEASKLLATLLNNVGVSVIVSGTVAPVFGLLYGVGHPISGWIIGTALLSSLVVGLGFHLLAQRVLRRLRG